MIRHFKNLRCKERSMHWINERDRHSSSIVGVLEEMGIRLYEYTDYYNGTGVNIDNIRTVNKWNTNRCSNVEPIPFNYEKALKELRSNVIETDDIMLDLCCPDLFETLEFDY